MEPGLRLPRSASWCLPPNPAAEPSALGGSPLSLHTCTKTSRCGALLGETPRNVSLTKNCSSPGPGHWGQPRKGCPGRQTHQERPSRANSHGAGHRKTPQKGVGEEAKKELRTCTTAEGQPLGVEGRGWRGGGGHQELRKGVDAARLPEGGPERLETPCDSQKGGLAPRHDHESAHYAFSSWHA